MTELVIVRGLPGCGKTTYARGWVAEDRAHRARVNRDDLRKMVDDGEYIKGVTEGRILVAAHNAIFALLKRGVSVVSDDTNLPNRTVRDLQKIAHRAGADVRIHDMTDVDLDTARTQNAHRDDKEPIPYYVIEDMYRRYIKDKGYPLPVFVPEHEEPEIRPYNGTPGKPPTVVVDIDGTVALKGTRSPFDESRVNEDTPNFLIVVLVMVLKLVGFQVVFCSGRSDGCREETLQWLRDVFGFEPVLNMRKKGDTRKDAIVKQELFDEFIRNDYNVYWVLDDRNQVVEMWRELGLTCLQVAPGDF